MPIESANTYEIFNICVGTEEQQSIFNKYKKCD